MKESTSGMRKVEEKKRAGGDGKAITRCKRGAKRKANVALRLSE